MAFIETLWGELAGAAADTLPPNVRLLQLLDPGRFAEQERVAVPGDPELRGPPPVGGVVVVAHHAGSDRDVEMAGSDEDAVATVRNVVAIAESSGIDPRSCFFTTAYPGVRVPRTDAGVTTDAGYDAFARSFLVRQCALLRPALVIVLGKLAAHTLARWFSVERWSGAWTFPKLCAAGACVSPLLIDGVQTTGIVIPHPTLSSPRFYRYGGSPGGRQAVVAGLSDAWRLARAKSARAGADLEPSS